MVSKSWTNSSLPSGAASPTARRTSSSYRHLTWWAGMAYTAGLEHTTASIDGQPRGYTLRATQVYRREDGEWKGAHRHGGTATGCVRLHRAPDAGRPTGGWRVEGRPPAWGHRHRVTAAFE